MTGYFYLSRGLFDHPLFPKSKPLSEREAWIWLIEHANYATQRFRSGNAMIDIPRGSVGTHYRSLAREWNWSVNRVIRVLNLFQKQEMIALKTEQQMVQITLCNYERYQQPWDGDGTATEQQRNTDGTATDTKRIKVIKEKKETKRERSRATRLLKDWDLPEDWGRWAESQGLTPQQIILQCDKFKDYWIAKAGANACKTDWEATWRNWIRRHLEDFNK